MAGFKENLKDLGRRAIGRGAEVDFKKEAEQRAAAAGIPLDEARTQLLKERLENVFHEVRLNNVIGNSSEYLEELNAALNEMKIDQPSLKAMLHSPHHRALPVPPVAPNEYATMRQFYANNFDGKTPSNARLHDAAFALKAMQAHLDRFISDAGSATDISAHLSNPAFAADLGYVLHLKDTLARHEQRFELDLKRQDAWESLKGSTMESLATVFWKGPADYWKFLKKEWKKNHKKGAFERLANTVASGVGRALVGVPIAAAVMATKFGFNASRWAVNKTRHAIA